AFRAGIRDYVPRPFLDEELVIRVHRIAAPVPASATAPGSGGLRGSLGDIGLGTLLSLLEFERKSGVLMLLRQHEIARVFVAEGRMLKVESSVGNGSATPKDRLMRLLDWRDGQFEFSPATSSASRSPSSCSSTRAPATRRPRAPTRGVLLPRTRRSLRRADRRAIV